MESGQVIYERLPMLLNHISAGDVPAEFLLGRNRQPHIVPWDHVTFLDEHPFFAPQTRWVLANCGIVDPAGSDEYLAHGGYSTYFKAIHSMTQGAIFARRYRPYYEIYPYEKKKAHAFNCMDHIKCLTASGGHFVSVARGDRVERPSLHLMTGPLT